MLSPKRVKFRKRFKGRTSGLAHRGGEISFGTYGLQALEPGWITARQIEAARVALTRHIKRGGKVWIRLFPDKPITKKPAETRMGKGKGSPEMWVAVWAALKSRASRAITKGVCRCTRFARTLTTRRRRRRPRSAPSV